MAYSLTNLPVLVHKKKALVTLGAFFLTLNLLILTCCIYTSGQWFFVSFTALLFGFSVVFAPAVLRNTVLPEELCNHKALISMSADTLLLFLLLTAVGIYQNTLGSLLCPTGVLTVCLLILPWSFLIVIRYVKVNAWLRASICLTASGLYILTINGVSDIITANKPFSLPAVNLWNWSEAYINGNILTVITAACLIMALFFAAVGISRLRAHKTEKGRQ